MKIRTILAAGAFLAASHLCAFAANVLSVGVGSAPNDATGDTLRIAFGKINTAVNGLAACFNSTTAPSFLMTYQCWFDTSAVPATLRYYDGSQWVAAGTLNSTTHVFAPQGGMTIGGDLTGTLPNPTLLTSVNANVGTFGSASLIPIITANNKGQITAVSTATATAAAGTLTGTTLAANVLNSSLTSHGVLTSGTWHGSIVQPQWGGTGVATLAIHGLLIGNGTGNVVVSSPGSAGQVLTSNGAAADPTFQAVASNAVPPPQGRLTLATGMPMMGSSLSGQTTVFYTPHNGNFIPLPASGGGPFVATLFTELSQTTTDTTKSPAAVAANSCYDMFVWNDLGTIRLSRGPAWTTCVGAGVRAAGGAIARAGSPNNGYPVNSSAITNGPGVGVGLWVGTIASNASSTIDWIFGSAGVGGTAGRFAIWNTDNQVSLASITQDTTGTSSGYAYTTTSFRQANASAGMQCAFVSGSSTRSMFGARYYNEVLIGAVAGFIGIGFNSTTATSGVVAGGIVSGGQNVYLSSEYRSGFLGLNTFAALEKGGAAEQFDINGNVGVGGLVCDGFM